MAQLNQKVTFDVTPTLAGAPGKVDPNSPMTVTVEPAANAVVENVALNADGSAGSFEITASVVGELAYTVKADKNLAAGVLDIVATGVIQVVEAEVIGADALTVAERPAA